MTIQDQTVLIFGGSNGMGLAAAKQLAQSGAKVIIAGRNAERLQTAVAEIGRGAAYEQVDFSNETQVKALFERVTQLDHLVLCAGSNVAWGAFAELEVAAVRRAFENKFWGYWMVSRYALPRLRATGSITMVTGAAHRTAIPGTAGLAAVNNAIAGLAQTLAKEIAPVRVNVVSPGLVKTPAYDWMEPNQRQGFYKSQGEALPLGRVGEPEEIAAALVQMVTNNFITGAVLDIDGGTRVK